MTTPTDMAQALPDFAALTKMLGMPDATFEAWRDATADKHWKHFDLSALRIGYELGKAAHDSRAQPASEEHECAYENGDGVCRECQALAAQTKAQPASDLPQEYALPGTWGSHGTGTVTAIRVNDQMFIPTNEDGGVYLSREAAMQFFGFTAQPASVVGGWRVIPFTGSVNYGDDRWEVYDPSGSGGVVRTSDVRLTIVRDLLDALAAAPQPAQESE